MTISKRLESLAKYINKNDKIIDIGCDHALLDIYIIENKLVDKMIVGDVHDGALKQGISNIKKHKLSNNIDARLGSGLEVLTDKDDIDTILISGMGTSTILSILDNPYLNNINKLIIQSNNDHTELRDKIIKMGYLITHEEYLVDNKKNYINEVFIKGSKEYTNDEIKYGPILIHDKAYLEFELSNIKRIKNIIPKMKLKYKLKLYKEERKLNKLIKNTN